MRLKSWRHVRFWYAPLLLVPGTVPVGPASAQEFVQTFRDPAFGGNPFNGDYLLSIANLHRPKAPDTTTPPTEDELLASQIKSQLTSSLSLNVLSTIQTAKVGQSGKFVFGDQQISYSKSATATTVTFTNTSTGATSQIVVPVAGATTTAGLASTAQALSAISAEQALGASVTSSSGSTTGEAPL